MIILPEMTFTGYVFKNRNEISPFLESGDENSPTIIWCRKIATFYKCYIAAGFPQKTSDGKYFNSMCLIGSEEGLIKVYAKHFLYETDKTWCDAGPEFVSLNVKNLNKQIGLAICMDLNPYEYIDHSLYEFGNFHKQNHSNLILFLANWLDSSPLSDDTFQTLNYWCGRLKPLIGKDVILVGCNRVGTERGSTFTGSSCVLSLKEPQILAAAPKRGEHVLIYEV